MNQKTGFYLRCNVILSVQKQTAYISDIIKKMDLDLFVVS